MRRALPLALLLAGLACADAETGRAPEAPVAPRATWVLEPARLRIGDVAALELAVVTPPGYAVAPVALPEEVPGVWILGAEAAPREERGARWIQRTRVRVRTRALGRFEWPATRVRITAPGGAEETLEAPAHPFEVASVVDEYPGQTQPFGVLAPGEGRGDGELWVGAAAGALFTLAAVSLVALARRRPADAAGGAVPSGPPPEPPWVVASRALAAARERAASRPLAAADAAAVALRAYADARYGSDSAACTTEELAQATPPFALTTRWPGFVSLLRRLDALRFPEASPDPAAVGALVAEAESFVEETRPPGEPG